MNITEVCAALGTQSRGKVTEIITDLWRDEVVAKGRGGFSIREGGLKVIPTSSMAGTIRHEAQPKHISPNFKVSQPLWPVPGDNRPISCIEDAEQAVEEQRMSEIPKLSDAGIKKLMLYRLAEIMSEDIAKQFIDLAEWIEKVEKHRGEK
ncbi:MAG TPA: hypothetical protein ENK38_02020 [Gammaproteobacteria bacterium]|nr:hypothetical protein [Gammaproteobacteria bacterium]